MFIVSVNKQFEVLLINLLEGSFQIVAYHQAALGRGFRTILMTFLIDCS